MILVIVLVSSLLVFRGWGAAGVGRFASWAAATHYALAVMLCFTAVAHSTRLKADMVRMMPRWVLRPLELVYFTGVCEFAGAGYRSLRCGAWRGSRWYFSW